MIVNYDLKYQPYSLGDVLTWAVASQIPGEDIRFVFTYDIQHPHCTDHAFRNIHPGNYRQYLAKFMDAPYASPRVKHVDVIPNGDLGKPVWPEKQDHYSTYDMYERITSHYKETGEVPRLRSTETFDPGRPYVSVNLRNNPDNPFRNSEVGAWFDLFRAHPNELFVTIGELLLDGLPNLLHVDNGTMKDLAVIENSRFHMGTASGPCEFAKFGKKPYSVIEKTDISVSKLAGFDGDHWIWSTEGQKTLVGEETFSLLEREYQRLSCG